jgi:predicted aconitase
MALALDGFTPAGGWSSADRYLRTLADVNGDHKADIVGFGEAGVYVSLATGAGTFGPTSFALAGFAPAAGAWSSADRYPRELADVNGDGMADIVGFGESGVYVSLATGGGSFGSMALALAGFAPSAGGWNSTAQYPRALADVNGDHMADIIGFGDAGVYVSLANGDGSFGSMAFALAGFAPSAGGWSNADRYPRELADVNGDGMADIVGFGESGVYVALATGGGSFGSMSLDVAAFAPLAGGWTSAERYPRHLADVNHDGAADIVGFGEAGVYAALSNGLLLV